MMRGGRLGEAGISVQNGKGKVAKTGKTTKDLAKERILHEKAQQKSAR